MLYKETHQVNADWDIPLNDELCKKWNNYWEQTQAVSGVRLPRWIQREHAKELHVFGDASGDAFGACAYLVGTKSVLLGSKGHLTKSPSQTIPKLELEAAVEAMNLGIK